MVTPSRLAALASAAFILSACNSTGTTGPAAAVEEAKGPPASAFTEGVEPRYCPKIVLREGTAILKRQKGDALDFVASVTGTSRDCRIIDGQLHMKVGVAGRVVPGSATKAAKVNLPIRIAVVRGNEVQYSQMGRQSVTLEGGATQFVYVDEAVVVPQPTAQDLQVFAGFDEGPQS
ncbi:hypothetical protein [Mangrovicella endophytica]|uniref:hypothetical protein n=1 Tax=Mangrovicella endophytica TaxID=2066697 RepID=UPI000C9EB6EE|nr:hypothetical protein [Mangrovicella endophytica]